MIPGTIVEVEGEVIDVLWRNPHAQVSMRVIAENGDEQLWEMAMDSVSNMRRWKIDPSFIEVGDRIRVAGDLARGVDHGLYIRNILTSSGEEVVLGVQTNARWSAPTIGIPENRRLGIGDPTAPELGIYRVWDTPGNSQRLFQRELGQTPAGRANLTRQALETVDAFDWERDNPLKDCALKGMPLIMESPYPLSLPGQAKILSGVSRNTTRYAPSTWRRMPHPKGSRLHFSGIRSVAGRTIARLW